MRLPLRPFLTAAALAAIGGFAAVADGCASKAPQPESAATAAPTPKPESKPAGTGASAGAETSSAGAGVSADGGASAGAGTSAGGGVSSGGGTSAGRSASADSPSGSALPRDRAQTSDERRAALDKRLNDSLGSFDAQLRKEQQKIALERDARQAAVTTVAATDGSVDDAATDPPHKPTVSHRGDTESRSARSGDLKSDRSASGTVSASGNGAVANEIPDGNDDDVIARRLRKAAEQETDPELKDKLWKEYVEYKKNTQGK